MPIQKLSGDLGGLLDTKQREVELLKRLVDIHKRFDQEVDRAYRDSGLDPLTFPVPAGMTVSSGPYVGLSIPEACKRYLQETPTHAASTPEIANAIRSRGIQTNAKNFTATVYTILQQSELFKRKGKLWTLVEGR